MAKASTLRELSRTTSPRRRGVGRLSNFNAPKLVIKRNVLTSLQSAEEPHDSEQPLPT